MAIMLYMSGHDPGSEVSLERFVGKIRELSLIDPAELATRISEGVDLEIPDFFIKDLNEESLLRPWRSAEPATPQRLTERRYREFLEGKTPSKFFTIDYPFTRRDVYSITGDLGLVSELLTAVLAVLVTAAAFVGAFSSEWFRVAAPAIAAPLLIVQIVRVFARRRIFQGLRWHSHLSERLELRRRLAMFTRGDESRQQALTALRHALDAAEFKLLYQPKVDIRSGRIVGLEAFIRWNRPGHSLVSPVDFVPLLEDSGLIVEVGAWVLRQSAADYRDWLQQGLSAPRIAVNVSPLQLRHSDFITVLERAIAAGEQPRAAIDIEITEGVLMDKTEEVIDRLNAVRRMGVQVAIDDFGTGYSSLRYLARLPIDTLKIDRSFVTAMTDDPDDMAIVSSIITLAHGLDLNVVAEGVETEEQHKLLRLLRCDQMQGYLFSKPVAKAEVERLLRSEAAITPSATAASPADSEFTERRIAGRKGRSVES